MTFSQRRGFLRFGNFSKEEVYAELDYVHQVLNQLSFPLGDETSVDVAATVFSRRIYARRPGLTITLPVLKKEDDGWVLFVQDRSGEGGLIVKAPPGQVIATTAGDVPSITLAADNDFTEIQWDFKAGKYYEIL